MTILPKALREEKFEYTSSRSGSDLKADLQKLFSEKRDSGKRISGRFISDNEFYLSTTTSAVIFSDNGQTGRALMKGKIETKDMRVIIGLLIKPVPRIYVLFYGTILLGLSIIGLLSISVNHLNKSILLYALLILVLFPVATLYLGQTSKNRLRKRVVDQLNLHN